MTQRFPPLPAIVPVKPFARAKRRLAPLLSPPERIALCRAMLGDVLAALRASPDIGEVLVVTSDSDAAILAGDNGASVIADGDNNLNTAISLGLQHLAGRGQAAAVIVPADLPQLSPTTLAACRKAMEYQVSIAIVPATYDGGTNLLAMRPIGLISPSFGPDSFAHHTAAARAAGANPLILKDSEANSDIDRPDDIAHFLSLRTQTRTQAFLERIAVLERLRADNADAKALESLP
jgi:2-phospho-L-lactate guanylyltransferase